MTDSADDHLDTAYLDNLTMKEQNSWNMKIKFEGKEIPFKVDTGAEVTAISTKLFQDLKEKKLTPPKKTLSGPT